MSSHSRDGVSSGNEALGISGRGRSRRSGIVAGNRSASGEEPHRKRGSSLSRSHVNRARADRRNRSSDAIHRNVATATGGRRAMRRSSSVNALSGPKGRRGHAGTGDDLTSSGGQTPRPQLEKVSSQSSFNKRGGYHASAGANLEEESTQELEISFDVASVKSLEKPRSASPSALNAANKQSIFAMRGKKDLRTVDQSVNLMDAEAGNYSSRVSESTKAKAKPRPSVMDFMFGGLKNMPSRTTSGGSVMSSMSDIDLGPDPSRRRMTHFYLQQKAAQEDNPWNKCCNGIGKATKPVRKLLCSAPFLASVVIILTLFFWMPYLQDKYNRLPTWAPTPAETPEPTQAPTLETPEPTAKTPEPTAAPAVTPSVSEQEAATATEETAVAEEDAAVALEDKKEQGEAVASDKTLGGTESEKDPMNYTASGQVKTPSGTDSEKDPIVHTASGEMKTLNNPDSEKDPMNYTASGQVKTANDAESKKDPIVHTASGEVKTSDNSDSEKEPLVHTASGEVTKKSQMKHSASGAVTKESSDSFVDKVMNFIPLGTSSVQGRDDPVGADGSETTPVSFSPEQEAEFVKMLVRMVEIQRLVTGRNLTSMEDLHNPRSPQNQALTWLITTTSESDDSRRRRRLDSLDSGSDGDNEESSAEEEDDSRTVERYVAAVLFFSLHNTSEIEQMYVDLYYAHQNYHVWKDSDLWAHGYGFDGLPLGNESQYAYNGSTFHQHYWNYSDYADGSPHWDGSDFEADYGFDWDDTEYSQHFDASGKSLWNEEKQAYDKRPPEPVSSEDGGVTGLKKSGNAPTNGGRVLDTGVLIQSNAPTGSLGGGAASTKLPPPKVFTLSTRTSTTKQSKGRYLRRRRRLDSLLRGKWMSDHDICKWMGVHCNGAKQVAKLDLSGHHLKGSIPSEIKGLEDLGFLDLSENHLHGSIPSEIGSLKLLHELLLQDNKLQGQVPSTVEDLPLLVMKLDHNKLDGPIPTNVATLTALKELWLNHNALNGTLPVELEGMAGLQKLHLEINHFTGPVPKFLTNAANLVTLRLHKNLFTGTISASLCAATNQGLQFLSADCNSSVVCNCCDLCF